MLHDLEEGGSLGSLGTISRRVYHTRWQTHGSCGEHNISEATFYRWKKKYGDMSLTDAKRLKELEKENSELKKMLAEAMLENRVLKEVNIKNW